MQDEFVQSVIKNLAVSDLRLEVSIGHDFKTGRIGLSAELRDLLKTVPEFSLVIDDCELVEITVKSIVKKGNVK